tara:strand:- start:127 stop:588 length:462 start_codon:yes stop_codon:yes gene_type:complete
MTYKIRKWEKQDTYPLLDLAETMWAEGAYNHLQFSKTKLKKTFDFLLANPHKGMGWVAVKDGRIIGTMIVHLTKYIFSDEILCNDLALYVDPKERKSIFVPIRLIKTATEWAKEMGAKEFCPASSVAVASDKVEKLYKFMKFETVGHLFKKRL